MLIKLVVWPWVWFYQLKTDYQLGLLVVGIVALTQIK